MVVDKYLATFLINYMYSPSWNGHLSQFMQKKYAGNIFSEVLQNEKKEKASVLDDLAVQHHSTNFSRSLPSQCWLSKVLDASGAACRGEYAYLPLPEFCYS